MGCQAKNRYLCRVHGVNLASPVEEFLQELKNLVPDTTVLDCTPLGSDLHLNILSVPEPRRKGEGTLIMETLTGYADSHGMTMHLIPDSGFGTPLPVLVQFYMKHGFTVNYTTFGSSRIMESMSRNPQ